MEDRHFFTQVFRADGEKETLGDVLRSMASWVEDNSQNLGKDAKFQEERTIKVIGKTGHLVFQVTLRWE